MSYKYSENRKDIPVLCTICKNELFIPYLYCKQCRQALCNSCVELHDKFTLLKDHTKYKVSKIEECKREECFKNKSVKENPEFLGADKGFTQYDDADTDLHITFKLQTQLRNNKLDPDITECKREIGVEGASFKNSDELIRIDDFFYTKGEGRENEKQPGGKGESLQNDKSVNTKKTNEPNMEPPLVPPRIKNFHVTVQNTPLAVKINVVGKRVLAVRTERMFIEDADSKVSIVSIPFKLIRKFSNQAADVLSIDVGRKFEYGEGTIDFESTEATKIFNLMESYLRKKP
ncbi:uncharacterized protein LOC127863663 [Dreissena polymorpha]|uniref:uncharacterized protein LOC127863663 n=1 Tax=Dreissena polymorpha TaxID=45954 RepID=UPI002264F953|nr:uncharacterized protein LOC127863663 [Dreissena polymorpha]